MITEILIARTLESRAFVPPLSDPAARLSKALVGVAVLAIISGCAVMHRHPVPSLDDVIRMSEEDTPDEQIINQLSDSGAVYPLTASRIVELHQQGVSEPVLDHMQQAYIENIRRRERMIYAQPFWGYPGSGCAFPYRRAYIYCGYWY